MLGFEFSFCGMQHYFCMKLSRESKERISNPCLLDTIYVCAQILSYRIKSKALCPGPGQKNFFSTDKVPPYFHNLINCIYISIFFNVTFIIRIPDRKYSLSVKKNPIKKQILYCTSMWFIFET